jgi:ferric-dicitrate binding protein FerR (iron transport regulator)
MNDFYPDGELVSLPAAFSDPDYWHITLANILSIDKLRGGEQKENTCPAHRIHFLKTTWLRYAAAVILVVGAAAYFWNTNKKAETKLVKGNTRAQTNVAPSHDRAILTLANGQQIMLDSSQGNIVKQGSLTVVNLAGQLKYEGLASTADYNTITTPKGGQYQIVLPDGSKVWLNAASSIKFPTVFTGNVRRVEMAGEAYMEIARNPRQSFAVAANGVEIQVLGTSFNINAYGDESAVKTTLVDGSVKIINNLGSDKKVSRVLKPGQQAVVVPPANQRQKEDDQSITVQAADLAQALAWKNGVFQLGHTNLADIMRQLSRWYDIEVAYEKGVPDIKLWGEMKQNLTLFQVLDGLEKLGVKFRKEGRRIVILQ